MSEKIDFVGEAVRIWCKPEHEMKVMDVDFAQSIAEYGRSIAERVEIQTLERVADQIEEIGRTRFERLYLRKAGGGVDAGT